MDESKPIREQESTSLVLERLRTITPEVAKIALDAKQEVDKQAGIIIAKLDAINSVVAEDGQEYRFYAARVLPPNPENPNFVNPHLHQNGSEPYRFLAGTHGEMNAGFVREGRVEWNEPREVNPGDEVVIQGGQVHSFRNNGTEPTDFVFACPDSHLTNHTEETPGGDRYFTANLEDGIPPWYPRKEV